MRFDEKNPEITPEACYFVDNSCGGSDIGYCVPKSFTLEQREEDLRKQIKKQCNKDIAHFNHGEELIYIKWMPTCIIL
jgi:hypothetical protein